MKSKVKSQKLKVKSQKWEIMLYKLKFSRFSYYLPFAFKLLILTFSF